MADIAELERRLAAALDRIGAALDRGAGAPAQGPQRSGTKR